MIYWLKSNPSLCSQYYKDRYDGILAWLEKQKEQKPADLSEMMVHKEPYIAPVPTPMVADEQKPVVTHGETYHVDTLGTQQVIAGKMPQKPAEWSEEDWKLLDEVREHIIGVTGDKPDLTPNKIYDGFLDLIDRLKFAKPKLKQEWSKEDKDVIDEAAELALGWGCPNLSAKLKSILSRVKPAEWSDEDEKYLNRVINLWVNDFGEDSDTAKWLKSLRPSWKPSEEQLNDLADAINKYIPARQCPTLHKLYQELIEL